MAEVKRTLPRHTILANQGLRIVTTIFDFAVMMAYSLPIFFGLFLGFRGNLTSKQELLNNYTFDSALTLKADNGSVKYLENNGDELSYNNYIVRLRYFYLNYLTGVSPSDESEFYPKEYKAAPNYDEVFKFEGQELKAKDYYTVDWFNTNVLGITSEDPDGDHSESLFTYVKNENPSDESNKYDKSKVGVRREHRYDGQTGKVVDISFDTLNEYLMDQYKDALARLYAQSFYRPVSNTMNLMFASFIFVSFSIGYFFSYIFVPLLRKDGATFGRMILKMQLANSFGYKHSRWQILLRCIPFYVTFTALCFLPLTDMSIVLVIALVILLVSFALMMASPKRRSLSDFTSGLIVVDKKGSIIFDTSADELAYIMEEDGLVDENGNLIEEKLEQ